MPRTKSQAMSWHFESAPIGAWSKRSIVGRIICSAFDTLLGLLGATLGSKLVAMGASKGVPLPESWQPPRANEMGD